MILDSNIIIYAAEPGNGALRRYIARETPSVSVVSKIEVLGYHKLTPNVLTKLEELFSVLVALPVTDPVIEKAISLRRRRKMSLGDALIAATALVHNQPLATANTADYSWIQETQLTNPLSE